MVELYSGSGGSGRVDHGPRNVSYQQTIKESSTVMNDIIARSSTNVLADPNIIIQQSPPVTGKPEDFEAILGELGEKDNSVLEQFLDGMKMRVHHVRDEQGLTLLHHAVLKLVEGKVKALLDFARKDNIHEDDIIVWINQPTLGEGWSALHYAAFSSNLDAICCLIENNADIYAINQNELTMLHVATQGDSPAAVYLFAATLGLDINKRDKRGCTPIHWACYSCSELALQYALALKPDVNV